MWNCVRNGTWIIALGLILTNVTPPVASCLQGCLSFGYVELQLISMENRAAELSSGDCCDGARGAQDGRCAADACDTYFRVCLKEYQAEVTTTGACTYGSASTQVLGGDSFHFEGVRSSPNKGTVIIPFQFAWPVSRFQIFCPDDLTQGEESLIERSVHKGVLNPGERAQLVPYNGPTASLLYSIRVRCDKHYYGNQCKQHCQPRDDYFGHYACDPSGNLSCMEGWMGPKCATAVCRQGCNLSHGSCIAPGECRCKVGWQGPLCNECVTYPGCLHGSCDEPGQCRCHKNWGGILCDKDLNYCGTHRPCKNGAICMNPAPGEYHCVCPEGYSGRNCEIAEHACVSNPCANGGTCHEVPSGFECHCPHGWAGRTCAKDTDECASNPCAHGGTCIDLDNGFECVCLPQWIGKTCQIDVASCYGQCQNGGTCKEGSGGYTCSCQPGFVGTHCELQLRGCASVPCKNGGRCHAQADGFVCECLKGFSGTTCEVSLRDDPCYPNPCQNKAQCHGLIRDFYCACSDEYEGKTCSHLRDHCRSSPCEVIDSCTIAVATNTSEDGVRHISSNVCGPHGRCISQPGGNFSCACQPGFTGMYCHENINDCVSSPCVNGGTCVDGVGSFKCICPDGREGRLCELDVNECNGNPCKNGGLCVDLLNDFSCQCTDGWKGKTCHSRDSQCDSSTCSNGGTCFDHGDSFRCACATGWGGSTCNTAMNSSCESGPCENGGTCVGGGGAYTCICKDGWEGPTCAQSKTPSSCTYTYYSFVHCSPGFAGPDCRINMDECQSSPCTYGATCVDQINGFHCICPPGRAGRHCQEFIGVGRACWHTGLQFPHGRQWEEECNNCQCIDGNVKCTKVHCGRRPCLLHHDLASAEQPSCSGDQRCVPHRFLSCFQPPCDHWGVCTSTDLGSPVDTRCRPNSSYRDSSCARVTLVFNRENLPKGTTVESICSELRYLPISRTLANDHALLILCDQSHTDNSTVEVAMLFMHDTLLSSTSIQEVVSTVISALSKRHNSTLLLAVREVKVEPPGLSPSASYLVPVLCALFALLWLLCLLVCVWWMYQRRKERERSTNMRTEEDIINNQPLRRQGNSLPDPPAPHECNRLMLPLDRVGDGAEDEEEEEDESGLVVEKCPAIKYSKGGAVSTIHITPGRARESNQTSLSPKDNRCRKNINETACEARVKDLFV
uniref:Delta-like protein n=1 Tax=Denticeps clupeoides TaxID=299321 RepID=A0AAY4B7T8_9TELE